MRRLNLLKLRRVVGISQRELAERLAVQPSFLSAIENGKSRFPDDKIERLKEIVDSDDLSPFFYYDDPAENPSAVPPHTHVHADGDPITELLKHIHAQAHKDDAAHHDRISELQDRNDYLAGRNDRLSERLDQLRERVDELQAENFRLKEILAKNGLEW